MDVLGGVTKGAFTLELFWGLGLIGQGMSRNVAWFTFTLPFSEADQTTLTMSCSFDIQLQQMRPKGDCH